MKNAQFLYRQLGRVSIVLVVEKRRHFSFVQKFESLDLKKALKILADRAGIKLEKFRAENPAEADKENRVKERMFEIMEEATKFLKRNFRK